MPDRGQRDDRRDSDNVNQQAWQRAVNIRALVVLGVAAVFGTGLVQHSAFGHRSE